MTLFLIVDTGDTKDSRVLGFKGIDLFGQNSRELGIKLSGINRWKWLTFRWILMTIKGELKMKNICKSFMALLVTSSAFIIGFYLGKEKIIAKIPQFQPDPEENP